LGVFLFQGLEKSLRSVLGLFGVWFVRFCVGFSFCAGCVLGVFLFQGLEKSLRLSGTLVVRLL
jgi:hypothetical protein